MPDIGVLPGGPNHLAKLVPAIGDRDASARGRHITGDSFEDSTWVRNVLRAVIDANANDCVRSSVHTRERTARVSEVEHVTGSRERAPDFRGQESCERGELNNPRLPVVGHVVNVENLTIVVPNPRDAVIDRETLDLRTTVTPSSQIRLGDITRVDEALSVRVLNVEVRFPRECGRIERRRNVRFSDEPDV